MTERSDSVDTTNHADTGEVPSGGGAIPAQGGNPAGHGSRVAIARFEGALPDSLRADQGQELVNTLASSDWIANVQIMAVKNEATSIATQEKSMRRSSEGEFAGLLLIEALDWDSLDRAITLASEAGDITPDSLASYDLVFVRTAQQ